VSTALGRLRWPEWLIGAGSAVLLASILALPWYAGSVDGWHGLRHARWLIVVTVAGGFAAALFQAIRRGPAVSITLTILTGPLAAATTIWLIYRVLISPPGGDRLAGGFVGLGSAAAIVYGAWRSMRLDGAAAGDARPDVPVVDPTRPPEQSA
jgi:hypothetical protein